MPFLAAAAEAWPFRGRGQKKGYADSGYSTKRVEDTCKRLYEMAGPFHLAPVCVNCCDRLGM
jgi:hypothetical protein